MTETSRPSWLPSVGDIMFVLILQLLFGLLPNFLLNDGSTGWHLVTGHYVLENLKVPTTDLMSYTFPDKPWVAYEWLFDAVIAALDKLGGLKLVAVAAGSAIATLFLLLYGDCRRSGCHYLIALALCIVGSLVSAIHWLVRPHLVTFFGVYFFCRALDRFYKGEYTLKRLLCWLVPVMLIWVNCHPAFIMGFAILVIYVACDLFLTLVGGSSEAAQKAGGRLKGLLVALVACGAVSFANPYGAGLYHYIFEYLRQTAVISQTDEYRSPVFHGALQPACLELLFFALALGLAFASRRVSLPRIMTVLAFAHLSLSGVRSMPLFVIVALPVIAELLGSARPQALLGESSGQEEPRASKLFAPLVKFWRSSGATFDEVEVICTRHALPVVAVAVLSLSCFFGGKLGPVVLVESDFDSGRVPTENLKKLASLPFDHGFNYDNWGGFLRYKTGNRVFIDDRVDFYGQTFYLDYGAIAQVQPGWKELLDKYKIQWVLFPAKATLVDRLKAEPGWTLLGQDAGSALYARDLKK